MLVGVETVYEAPTVSGGHWYPPADNAYDLGSAAFSWRNIYVDTLIYVTGTVMQGDFLPSVTGTYDIGEGTTPYKWEDLWLNGVAYLGMTHIGETANTGMTLGLTINQGAYDDEILAFKSSDIAHGRTSLAETDTYALFKKYSATLGGLQVIVPAENAALTNVLYFLISGGTADTGLDEGARALIEFYAEQHSGADAQGNLGTTDNIFGVSGRTGAATKTKMLVNASGDFWIAGDITSSAFTVTNDNTITTLSTISGDYWRFGDAATHTKLGTPSEDDVMFTGKTETAGVAYFLANIVSYDHFKLDNGVTIGPRVDTDGHAYSLRARDVDGSAYVNLITLTNANDPTIAVCPSGGFVGFFGATAVGQQTGADELSTSYAEADIDTDAELVAVINVITTEVNALRTALNTLGITTTV